MLTAEPRLVVAVFWSTQSTGELAQMPLPAPVEGASAVVVFTRTQANQKGLRAVLERLGAKAPARYVPVQTPGGWQ